MLRSSLIAAGVGLLCSSALAQNVRTAQPINVPIKDGGTLDWATGTWTRNAGSFANAPGANVIFENTCNFSGGAFYGPNGECWDLYEEGRLPTGDATDPFLNDMPDASQFCNCYFLCGFQFGYCTNEDLNAGGNVQVQIGLLEGPNVSGIGGDCMNAAGALVTPTPPSGGGLALPPGNFGGPRDLFADITGLPGGNATNAGCWIITIDLSNNANGGFSFCGDGGDGTFDNDGTDGFNWLWGQRGTTETMPVTTGPFLAGDLSVAGGTGAFGVPQGLDPLDGVTPCGTGLGAGDFQWINIDGQPAGTTNPLACQDGGGALPAGSACYFFGGQPANPLADTYLILWANAAECSEDADGPGGDLTNYCTPKASSSGCLASMSGSAMSVTSGANDFSVIVSDMEAGRPGIFFGSNTSQNALPFQGGFLCITPPTKRSAIMFSFGTPGMCDGSFSLLVNDGLPFPPPLAGSGFDAGPGGTSFMQCWYRDPALMDGFDSALSDGLQIDWM